MSIPIDSVREMQDQYRSIAITSGRGYGKTFLMANLADPAKPTVEELQSATRLDSVREVGFSLAAGDDVTVYTRDNYEAQMTFKSNVLGNWDYTPADELRDRLNQRLKGEEPWSVINTRYWRGL